MSSFNNLFRNLNLSKKSQLSPIFRTGGNICYFTSVGETFYDKKRVGET